MHFNEKYITKKNIDFSKRLEESIKKVKIKLIKSHRSEKNIYIV